MGNTLRLIIFTNTDAISAVVYAVASGLHGPV
jgi:hypothetical protein